MPVARVGEKVRCESILPGKSYPPRRLPPGREQGWAPNPTPRVGFVCAQGAGGLGTTLACDWVVCMVRPVRAVTSETLHPIALEGVRGQARSVPEGGKNVFGNTLEVILDRRVEDRRRSLESTAGKRGHGDRRQHDTTKDLETFGWALTRR